MTTYFCPEHWELQSQKAGKSKASPKPTVFKQRYHMNTQNKSTTVPLPRSSRWQLRAESVTQWQAIRNKSHQPVLHQFPLFHKSGTERFHLGKSHLQKPQARCGCLSPEAAALLGLPRGLPQAALATFSPPSPPSSHLFCTLETPPVQWLPLKGRAWGKSCSKIQEEIELLPTKNMFTQSWLYLLWAHTLSPAVPRMAHVPFIPCQVPNVSTTQAGPGCVTAAPYRKSCSLCPSPLTVGLTENYLSKLNEWFWS